MSGRRATGPCAGRPSFSGLAGAGDVAARIGNAVTSRARATLRAAALALGLVFTSPVSDAIDAIANGVMNTVMGRVAADIGDLGFISPALGQPAAPQNRGRMRSMRTTMQ